jgi:hypothetical protein
MNLTASQVRFFRDAGYLRLSGLIDGELVDELRDFVIRESLRRSERQMGKLYGLYERNPSLIGQLVSHPKLVGALTSLLGSRIVFLTNRHNCGILHPSGVAGDSRRLHRDVLQWSRPIVTVLAYLEDSNLDTGCTRLVPNSQYLPFVDSGVSTGGTWMDEHEEFRDLLDQSLPVPMASGSVLILDANTFHSASANQSGRTRTTIALAYRSVDELDPLAPKQRTTILVSGEHIYRGNDQTGGTG